MTSGTGGVLSWVKNFGQGNAIGRARINKLISCNRNSGQFEVGGAVDDSGNLKAFLMSVSEVDGSIIWSRFYTEGNGMSLTSFDCESSIKIAASFVVYGAGDTKIMEGTKAFITHFSYSTTTSALTKSYYVSQGTNFCSFPVV